MRWTPTRWDSRPEYPEVLNLGPVSSMDRLACLTDPLMQLNFWEAGEIGILHRPHGHNPLVFFRLIPFLVPQLSEPRRFRGLGDEFRARVIRSEFLMNSYFAFQKVV